MKFTLKYNSVPVTPPENPTAVLLRQMQEEMNVKLAQQEEAMMRSIIQDKDGAITLNKDQYKVVEDSKLLKEKK